MTCDACRYSSDGEQHSQCATCGPDMVNFAPPVSDADLGDVAKQVEQRAADLQDAVADDNKLPDVKFIKQCLDANERGDGVLFASLHRGRFLYNVSVKDPKKEAPWYRWDQHVWKRDEFANTQNAVEEVALLYQAQADALDSEIRDKKIGKGDADGWKLTLSKKYKSRVERLRSQNGASKVLHWAPIVDQEMAGREGDFNQKPWLLPVANGVINLQTGVLQQGKPCDLLTKSLEIEYDPHADYSEWVKFVEEVADGKELADFLKRTFGYAATGFSHEQYIWVFVGPGRNGKGTMFDLLGDILGPYYHQISRAMLIEQRNEPGPSAASEHKYSLHGKRLIVGDETNKGQKIDGSAIKSLTGEDRINCRPNFRSEIVFKPTHTLFLHTNNIPAGLTKDFALRQRLLKIEFPWMYVDDPDEMAKKEPAKADRFKQKDKDLKDRLRQQKQGILRWIVEGCLEWQKQGLAPPTSILEAVEDLTKEEDYLGQFIEDCLDQHTEPDQEHIRTSCTTLHEAFTWWWSENMDSKERRVPGIKNINTQLRERGHTVQKHGGRFWLYRFTIKLTIQKEMEETAQKKRGKT